MKQKIVRVILGTTLLCAVLLAGCGETGGQRETTTECLTTSVPETIWTESVVPTDETTTEETTLTLEELDSPEDILQLLGYVIPELPEGAADGVYSAFALENFTVAQVTFTYKGANWCFRISNLAADDLPETMRDISGITSTYLTETDALISWCDARVSYDPGAEGKIIWNDFVPGLAYSLTTDSGANEWDLVAVAETLFVPAQGDVG